MKRIFIFLFATLALSYVQAQTSGTCGDNLTWSLDEGTGTLTITGDGAMYDYDHSSQAPWYGSRESIKEVNFVGAPTSIGGCAFFDFVGLTSIDIPASVTNIGSYAFGFCYSLTNIDISASVTSIGDFAFFGCYGLTSVVIPESVTSIGDGVFADCYGLTSIVVDEENTIYDSRGNCNAIIETATNTLIAGCKNTIILEGVASIGTQAFYGCDGLTSIVIPSSVISIGDYAFNGCSALTSIDIPSSVTSIGIFAFSNCSGLTSIEIPASVTSIGDVAFSGCTSLTSVVIPSSVSSIGDGAFFGCRGLTSIVSFIAAEDLFVPGNNAFNEIDKDACTLYVPTGAKSTYVATEQWKDFTNIVEFNGKCGDNAYWTLNEETGALTIFGEGAMYDYANNDANRAPWYSNGENITSVTIEEGVTSIGDWVFYNCTILTSIEIPSSVTSIGNSAFCGCTGLTSIEIPSSVTSIGSSAFYSCYGLTSVEIPSSVTSIGAWAFCRCSGLTSIEIPSSVTSINYSAFAYCRSLTSIVVGEGNTIYDSRGNCNAIIETASNTLIAGCKNTIIPEGVTSIGNSAFDGCSSLTSIEIHEGVTSIGDFAFFECTGLTSIVSHIAAENLFAPGSAAFHEIDKDACTLYVPAGAKSTYAATEQWKDFTNIVELKEVVNIVDGAPYTATEIKENVEVVYSRTFGNTNWQAWYVPFAIDCEQLSDDFDVAKINDIHQYDTDRNGIMDKTELEVVKLHGGTLKANYPYLVRAKVAGEKSITVSDATLEAAKNTVIDCSSVKLKYYFAGTCAGVSGEEMFDGKYYALSSGALMLAADNSAALKPLRWYMRIENRGEAVSAGVIKIRVLGDETTDVREVETEPSGEAVYYDLSGRRVENPTRGIYIVNGKKVYIK